MKTLSKLKQVFSLLVVAMTAGVATAQAGPVHELNEKHYVSITVPEDKMDQVRAAYLLNGIQKTAGVTDGEIVSLSIQDNALETLPVAFAVHRVGDDIVLQLEEPDPTSLKPVLGFHSTLEAVSLDKGSTLVITAPGATAAVVQGGNPQDEVAIPDTEYPKVIDGNVQNFSRDGVLNIKFFAKAVATTPDENTDGGNGGSDDGSGEVNPAAGASGGCSFSPSSAGSFSGIAFLALGLPLYWGARRSRRNQA